MREEQRGDLVPIADVATEFEARFLSSLLIDCGTDAQPVSNGLHSFAGLGRWSVMVRQSDVAAAHAHLVEMREAQVSDVGSFAECPECDYSLEGLAGASICPECGFDLAAESARDSTRDFDAGKAVPTGLIRRAMPWVLGIGVLCVVVGLFSWPYADIGFEERGRVPVALAVVAAACLVSRRIRRRGGSPGVTE